MNLLILYICLAIGTSFICSVLEAIILSVTPNYLLSIKDTEPKEFKKLNPLRENIEKPLASILTINTFAHTIGAAGAGAQAQHLFGNEWITIFSICLTLAILFFSEIIPKSIGANHWKTLAPFASQILPIMIFLTYPLVYISEILSKIFSLKQEEKISRDEIKAIVDIGFKDGALDLSEYNILKQLMKFKNITANDVMTSSKTVIGLDLNMTSDEISKRIVQIKNSRLPIFGVHHDDLKGYVLKNDLLNELALNKKLDLNALVKPILIVPSYVLLKTLFFRLLERKEHICAIVDDYGTFVGIVTLENIIETLLGLEIIDEFDSDDN
jgi:CBS domain containing-hemolysin-like protein